MLTVPLAAETRGMIDARRLGLMRRDAEIRANVARLAAGEPLTNVVLAGR